MSTNSDQILGQSTQNVFAQPLLQSASLLNNQGLNGVLQALSQGSHTTMMPNSSIASPSSTGLNSTTPTTSAASLLSSPTVLKTAATVPLVSQPGIDPLTGAISKSLSPAITKPALPDLVGSFGKSTLPSILVPGDRGQVDVVVNNQGLAKATGSLRIKLYASTSQSIDSQSVLLSDFKAQSTILPGQSGTYGLGVTVPGNLKAGTYYLIADINADHTISEQNVTNNTVASSTTQQVAWQFGTVGNRKNVNLTLKDAKGTPVTFSLAGNGTGAVDDSNLDNITLKGTDTSSAATISTSNSAITAITNVQVNGALGSFIAKNTDLRGNFAVSQSLGSLTLNNVNGGSHTLTIGSATQPQASASLAFNQVANLTLQSAMAINTLTATEWLNTNGSPEQILAPSLQLLRIRGSQPNHLNGDFAAGLNLTGNSSVSNTLGTAQIAGQATGLWNVTGNANSLLLGSASSGWSADVTGKVNTLSTTGNLSGTIAAQSLQTVTVGGDLTQAHLLAGTQLGADDLLGGTGSNQDTFSSGSIDSLTVNGKDTGSIVGAGLDPVDGQFNNGNDRIVSPSSTIRSITIKGAVSPDSLFATGTVTGNININGSTVNSTKDAHFLLDSQPRVSAALSHDTAIAGTTNTDGITSDPTVSGKVDAFRPTVLKAGFDSTMVNRFVDVSSALNPDGTFTLGLTQIQKIYGKALPDGTHVLHLQAGNKAGSVSKPFDLTFTLDTTAPGKPILTLDSTSDSGHSNHDQITNINTPILTGTAESGATVQLSVDGKLVGQTQSNGTWQIAAPTLTDGVHTITATAIDVAGNVSAVSDPLRLTIDTQAPTAPNQLQLTVASNTGINPQANITSNATPTIQGKAEAGSFVALMSDGQSIAETTADANGNWQVTAPKLADGKHQLTAMAADVAGNLSALSAPLTVTIDTIAPVAPSQLTLLASSDSGLSNHDQITQVATPTISGLAEAGAVIQLLSDGQVVGKGTVQADGTWQITATTLSDGTHSISAIATDAAGNVSSSSPLSLTIDTTAPKFSLTTPINQSPLVSTSRLTGTLNGTGSGIASAAYHFDNFATISITFDANGAFDQLLDFTGVQNGTHQFTVTITDAAGNTTTSSSSVTVNVIPASAPPKIAASLLNDTAPNGGKNSDGITSDDTISGTITDTNRITRFQAGLDNASITQFTDVLANLDQTGRFILTPDQIAQIYGGVLPDGQHTLHLVAQDASGKVSDTFDVTFTLDTTSPTLRLDTPIASGSHSATARLIGETDATGLSSLRYSLDGQSFMSITPDALGNFDQAIQSSGLSAGSHQVILQVTDIAGNQKTTAVAFQVSPNLEVGGAGTTGWGIQTADSILLYDNNSFLVQSAVAVDLGQSQGTRTLQFDLKTPFSSTATPTANSDRLLVYLVDPAHPNQTLLDRGESGTALFSLTNGQAEFPPGLVQYNGSTVKIDVTSLGAKTQGLLLFQLINQDPTRSSKVEIDHLTNTVDASGISSPIYTPQQASAVSGAALDLSTYTQSSNLKLLLSNVHVDATTGRYTANLQVQNVGTTPISRRVAASFSNLPVGVQLLNGSGVDANGVPYLNLRNVIPTGGLAAGSTSDAIEVSFSDAGLQQFSLQPTFLTGGITQPPTLPTIAPITITPGASFAVPIPTTDTDGDPISFSISNDSGLPTHTISNGKLTFTPSPDQIGTYHFTLIASVGSLETRQEVSLTIAPDPITTTRISGVIQDSEQHPISNATVELGGIQTVTAADGSFQLALSNVPSDTTLTINGGQSGSITYQQAAVSATQLLGHDPYAHFNNVLTHPIYVTAIDASKTQLINPAVNNTIVSSNDSSVSLNIPANTFQSTDGKPVAITVQTLTSDRLPINPPKGVSSEQVVFVNYGDAKCKGPIPLPPPNDPPLRGPVDLYYSPVGGTSQGWTIIGSGIGGEQGIQPTTGASGIGAGTVGGGYFFWAPTAFPVRDLNRDPRNPNTVCVACRAKKSFNSEVELHSGTLTETVKLSTYQSLGSTQGLSLRYDSMRADPRPILHFGMDNVPSAPDYRLVGSLSVSRGNFTYQVPGYTGTDLRGLSGGENFWSIPPGGGSVDAAMQVDLRNQASGQYRYSLTAGVKTLCDCNYLVGSSTTTIDKLTIVNRRDSAFGSGWDIAGLQELVENDDHSILLIDGDGTQLNFNVYSKDAATGITTYFSPAGDFSVLKQLADGTFTRTLKDQSVYTFNAQKKLVNVVDPHDLETDYVYNTSGQLTQVVDAMGRATTLSYNANGKVIAITDPASRTTQMKYDTAGNLIAIINPDNSQQSYQYDADHHLVAGVNPVGDTRQNFYDFAGRATRSIHNDGSTNQINPVEVQGLLRPDATTNPQNAPLAMPLGAAESTYVDSNGTVTKTLLDNAGDEISSTDKVGNTGSTQRDANYLPTQVTDALGHTTTYTYDSHGNVISEKDELSQGASATGSLFAHPLYPLGNSDNVVSTDINGDGKLDLISSNGTSVNVLYGDGQGNFSASAKLVDGSSFVMSDLNHDGHLDLITESRDGLSVYLNDGEGTFATPLTYTLPDSKLLELADLNGDGQLDILSVNGLGYGGDFSLSVLLNQGNGTFAAPVTTNPLNVASSDSLKPIPIAIADVNGDGKSDLILSPGYVYDNGDSPVLLSQGDGTFAVGSPIQNGGNNEDNLLLKDLNHDGHLDLISAGSSSVVVRQGQGDETFGNAVTYTTDQRYSTLALQDLNHDGNLDLVTTGQSGNGETIEVRQGKSDGTFGDTVTYTTNQQISSLAFQDLNHDGNLDLVTTGQSSNGETIEVRQGKSDGTFGDAHDYKISSGHADLLNFGDFNGDGRIDIATATSIEYYNGAATSDLFLQQSDGSFTEQLDAPTHDYAVGASPASVTTADINGDGIPDIITANAGSNTLSVRLGNGDGTFAPNINYAVGHQPEAVVTADLKGDGKLALISANAADNTISVLFGDGKGGFGSPTTYGVGTTPTAIAVGDVNGDGIPDLVVTNSRSNTVSVLLGDGRGAFGATQTYPVGNGAKFVALGDVNGDGKLDLVTANLKDNTVSVCLGNGDGSFGTATNYAVGNQPESLQLVDLNGDGKLDLVSANFSGSVSVLFGKGDGTFSPHTDYQVGNGASSLAVKDLNGDGILDVITANDYSGSVSVLLGQGNGAFSATQRFDFGINGAPESIAIADFNGDGALDFVIANASGYFDSNGNWVFYSSGNDTISPRLNNRFQIDTGSHGTGEHRYVYDPVFNKLISETDELGRTTRYELDPHTGDVLTKIQVVGTGGASDLVTHYTYNARGQMTSMTDPLGHVMTNDYNALGQLIQTTEAKGTPNEAIQRYEYDAAGNQTARIDANGHRTEYRYDAMNRLIQEVDADPDGAGPLTSPTTTYVYDAAGRQTDVIDARGNNTHSVYDSMGHLIKTIGVAPDAAHSAPITTYTYDLNGNLIATIDPLGRKTQSTYDARGRLTASIQADGTQTQTHYDGNSNATGDIDANGQRTTTIYDARGRRIRETDALGNSTRFVYDVANELIAQIDAKGHMTRYVYDDLGRQIEVIDPAGNITKTQYDKDGNVIAQTDALGHTTQYTYDALNRRTSTIDALGHTTTTTYDKVGDVLSVTDPDGNATTYAYDALNRLVSETNSLGKSRTYRYDVMGNRIAEVDRDSRETNFVYDALNRKTQENWIGANGSIIRTTTSTYDAVGQLIEVRDPDSDYHYTYDLQGRISSIDNTGTLGAPSVRLSYTYTANGDVLSVSDTINGQADETTAYTYDALDRLTRITQSGVGVQDKRVDVTYGALGQMSSLSRYSDLTGLHLVATTQYTYDGLNRLQQLQTVKSGGAILSSYGYQYDAASRITQIAGTDGTTSYSYDATSQLIGATSSSVIPVENYSYDMNGNRTNSGYATGSNNELTSDGTYTYVYDDEGNLIRQTETATGKVREFQWDYRNRLVGVVDRTGNMVTQQVSYTYDTLGQRIAKTVNGTTTRYVYDRGNVSMEFTGNTTTPSTRYLFGANVDQVLAQESASRTTWMLTDHEGSVRDLIDTNGTMENHYVYNAFGKLIASTADASADTRYRYTGREWDAETGLDYNRARYYDENVGRFISQDPMSFSAGDTYLYRYVENNPTNATDPSGQAQVRIIYNALLPLGDLLLPPIRVSHAYIVVDDTDCEGNKLPPGQGPSTYYRGGPSLLYDSNKVTAPVNNLWKYDSIYGYVTTRESGGAYVPGSRDYNTTKAGGFTLIRNGESSESYRTNLLNTMIQIENRKIPYRPKSTNSNSAAHTAILKLVGRPVEPPVLAPGWQIDLLGNPKPTGL